MKKTLLALAAVAAVTAGSAAAQAKVHFNVYLGTPAYDVYVPHYEPVGYYKPSCKVIRVKVVKTDYYGNRIVTWKNKKVCKKVYYNSY